MSDSKASLKGLLGNYAGLPFSIYILFIARVINRLGGFVHAFLTLFLSLYLGMSESEIGTYVFLAGLAGLFGSLIGGKLGDTYSRKVVYLVAQGTAALFFLPCAWLAHTGAYESIPYFLIASSFFGAVVRPVNTAMVADAVDKEDRKRAFSLLYLGINIGVAIGPIVAAILLKDYLLWFFLGDAITTFIAVFLVAIFVRERRITEEEMDAIDENDREAKETGNIILALFRRPMLLVFVLFSTITSMMYAQVSFAFPLLMEDIFGEAGANVYATQSMFNAVVVIAFTALIHYMTRGIKPIYNIAMAALLYAVGMGMLAVVSAKGLIYLSTFVWTLGEIQAVTNQNVYLMGHTPINYRSRFMAAISIITSLGYVASPKIGGLIIEQFGQDTLWKAVFIGGLIAAMGYIAIGHHENKKEQHKDGSGVKTT